MSRDMKNELVINTKISVKSNRYKIIFLFLTLVFFSRSAYSYGLAFGYGLSGNLYGLRLSLQADDPFLCLENEFLPTTTYWEGSANYISTLRRTNNTYDHIEGLSVAYVFHFEKKDYFALDNFPYAELGLGFALFDNNVFAGRHLSHGLLEIKIGTGFRFGDFKQYDISYKFIHYSNVQLERPKQGINLNFIVFSFLF